MAEPVHLNGIYTDAPDLRAVEQWMEQIHGGSFHISFMNLSGLRISVERNGYFNTGPVSSDDEFLVWPTTVTLDTSEEDGAELAEATRRTADMLRSRGFQAVVAEYY